MDDRQLRNDGKESESQCSTTRPRGLAKTKRVLRVVAATDSWKRQIQYLVRRFTFPLLRHILRSELRSARSTVMLSTIPMKDLKRSRISHAFVQITMALCFVWALVNIAKGLVAAVRFDIYLTTWLISGIPLAFFAVTRFWMSNRTYRLVTGEIEARQASEGRRP